MGHAKGFKPGPRLKIFLLLLLTLILFFVAFFLPAGSLYYWEAWVLMGVIFIPFTFVALWLVKHDPSLVERRMRYREKRAEERKIIRIVQILFIIGMLIPGFDYRYGWSDVPFWLVIASDVIVFLGYMLVFSVFRENSYTSRIVEVEKSQKVITTGPYSVVRHPMYVGVILMYVFMPLALGSYYALIPIVPSIFAIILRIFDEEKLLTKDLEGYREYCKKVRYRLIPGIW